MIRMDIGSLVNYFDTEAWNSIPRQELRSLVSLIMTTALDSSLGIEKALDEYFGPDMAPEIIKAAPAPPLVSSPPPPLPPSSPLGSPSVQLEAPLILQLRAREITGDQKSDQWLMNRHNYITASVSAACAGLMGPRSRLAQILEKASYGRCRQFFGGYSTEHGNIFEPVTNAVYSARNGVVIHAFSLIPDTVYPLLGASTDGVAEYQTEHVNIEIKTLASRKLDGKIKKEYYHQMQHQMHCLGLSKTHFLEAKYDQFPRLSDLARCKGECGVALEFYDTDFSYVYSPIGHALTELQRWEDQECTRPGYVRSIYWGLKEYMPQTVLRDETWYTTMKPAFQKFWDEVTELRGDPKKLERMISEMSGDRVLSDCLI